MNIKNKVVTVRAKKGREDKMISRLDDSRPVLFDTTHPLTGKIEEGNIVEGKIVYETKTFVIVRPLKIIDGEEYKQIPMNEWKIILTYLSDNKEEIKNDYTLFGTLKPLLKYLGMGVKDSDS